MPMILSLLLNTLIIRYSIGHKSHLAKRMDYVKNTPEEAAGLQTVIDNHQTLLPAELAFFIGFKPIPPV